MKLRTWLQIWKIAAVCFLSFVGMATASTDSGITTLALDTRDYTLEVKSNYGTPSPYIGDHSSYCWNSTVTCTVDSNVSVNGSSYVCSGWTGTGSVSVTGESNSTGQITLSDVHSTITWNWSMDSDSDGLYDGLENQSCTDA